MRVVHVIDRIGEVGGVRSYLEVLFPALAARGIDSVAITSDPGITEFAGAEVIEVPGIEADGPDLPAAARRALRGALDVAKPDVVYVQVAASPAVAAEAMAAAPVLLYAHDHGMVCPGNARYLHRSASYCAEGPGLRCFERAYTERCTNRRPDRVLNAFRRAQAWARVLPGARSLLVASPFMARELEAAGAAGVKVVPYPVAAPGELPPAAQPGVDVLYVGRFVAVKGARVLLEALAELPEVTAALAGDGPERPELEALAGSLGIGDRARFTGWVSPAERLELFASSRVLAFPALWQEPFGLIGVEALAAGLPVVASDVGGIPSWLDDGEGGLLVPPGDPARLASALGRVLEDDALRERLSAAGPGVASRFSVDRHLDLLLPELQEA